MKVVSPFRPFVPESIEHLNLGPFDWYSALEMARASVERVGGEWFALTDVDTSLAVPALYYETRHRRLMLWIVEVSLRYLESDDFDRDTVMMSPDVLLFEDLSQYFQADLGVLARLRPKYQSRGKYLLNGLQWWRHEGKARLVEFYRRALEIAVALPEDRITWGADTDPLVQLLSPVDSEGIARRSGVSVTFIDECKVFVSVTESEMIALQRGRFKRKAHAAPACDFRYTRKRAMAAYFAATVGASA